MLPLTVEQVHALRRDHAIYMADSGRFNVLGMADHALGRFIAAVIEAMDAEADARWRRRSIGRRWRGLVTTSRALDHLEETRLVPRKRCSINFRPAARHGAGHLGLL